MAVTALTLQRAAGAGRAAAPGTSPEQGRDADLLAIRSICELVRAELGIDISTRPPSFLQLRLGARLEDLGSSLLAYARLLREDPAELTVLADLVTTRKTAFFREREAFAVLRERLARRGGGAVLCAGCASGEEPYTIAMLMADADPRPTIVALDVSSAALAQATAGTYPAAALEPVPEPLRARFFLRGVCESEGLVRVKPALREAVDFRRVNLATALPLSQTFDAIFCRNVLIYFGAGEREALIERLAERLAPDGLLFLGVCETLAVCGGDRRYGLRAVGPSIYARVPT